MTEIKKVVVVYLGISRWIKGNKLVVNDTETSSGGGKILVIRETGEGSPYTVAVFKQWDCWYIAGKSDAEPIVKIDTEPRTVEEAVQLIHIYMHRDNLRKYHSTDAFNAIDNELEKWR